MAKHQVRLPEGLGEFETGCHTAHGNEVALFVQTTRELHERRRRAFAELLAAKRRWNGHSEFNVPLRLDRPGRQLFDDAVGEYNWKILRNKSALDVGELERQDFVAWLAREFDDYRIDVEIDERNRAA